ncbi:hypothetical protein JOQ06_026565, partial [Pogonophryne albipinna]
TPSEKLGGPMSAELNWPSQQENTSSSSPDCREHGDRGSQKEVVPEVPSAVASALPRRLAQALSRWNKRKRMFGAILSPHRQLQITHMASVLESMPLSTEGDNPVFG